MYNKRACHLLKLSMAIDLLDSSRLPASPGTMTAAVSKTPPGSWSQGYGIIVPLGTSLREPGVIKGDQVTLGRGPQLCHLVSIQVPWPGPAVGGLMARPMKRVIHQRTQPHAHKTYKAHSQGRGLLNTLTS